MRKHSPISRTRWRDSQKHTLEHWKTKSLHAEREKDTADYLPLLLKYAEDIPADGTVLEIGCGPVCLSQALPLENKSFLDPLIEDFRRMFPGELPEGEYLNTQAERIFKADDSFDLIICLNTLSYTLNPELVMNEIERLLKPEGKLILAMRIHSQLESRLHYWTSRYMPVFAYAAQPNCYSLAGLRRTLLRHFTITDEILSSRQFAWLPFFRREQRLFICTNANPESDSP